MSLITMHQQLALFWSFCLKDYAVLKQTIGQLALNHSFIYPITLACGFGATQLPSLVGNNPTQATTILLGNVLIIMTLLSYRQNVELLFDRRGSNVLSTQLIVAPVQLVVLQKLLFAATISFALMIPFFPTIKLILGSYLSTTHLNLARLLAILVCGHLFCASYTLFIACYLSHPWQLTRTWRRTNTILWALGGLFVPYYTMKKTSTALGYIVLLNPFTYLSDGLRGAFLLDQRLLPFWLTPIVLLAFASGFYTLSVYALKKNTDSL